MGLRDLLKKKERLEEDDDGPSEFPEAGTAASAPPPAGGAPEFTFIRSDTFTQEVIHPPADPHGDGVDENFLAARDNTSGKSRSRRSLDVFHVRSRSRSASTGSSRDKDKEKEKERELEADRGRPRSLSQRLHLSRSPSSSENVPADLPELAMVADGSGDPKGGSKTAAAGRNEDPAAVEERLARERQWEKRATMLALENEKHRSRPPTPSPGPTGSRAGGAADDPSASLAELRLSNQDRTTVENGVVSSKAVDADIQEAIRLHEAGEFERSTRLFGQLADPKGANNPLSQVLYGLALRHGWGCQPDPAAAVSYLSAAASNAALVESLALQAGLKKGGAAKGELVLAIFELANCFRYGWGIDKDPVAAKQYYETAANLGDADAMNEIAWCYLEGFGCKKDKYAAARYYRLAEQNGNKTIGNSWIWKEKYDPGKGKK